jgi:hypothetical protein
LQSYKLKVPFLFIKKALEVLRSTTRVLEFLTGVFSLGDGLAFPRAGADQYGKTIGRVEKI